MISVLDYRNREVLTDNIMIGGNLFENIPERLPDELLQTLHESGGVRIERILSRGQTTDGWYCQSESEWVALLQGAARLEFEGGNETALGTGDWLFIPAGQRHRVSWTDPRQTSLWLAVHLREEKGGSDV